MGCGVIPRDPTAATSTNYDAVFVGGGVYGACAALEAARRGLRVLLVERGDFGGATSWNSLRIVHGGLRYLQTADLSRFRESVGERAWWLRTFPDLVEPLPCLMPLYGGRLTSPRRPSVLRVALAVNDLLSAGRNRDVREDRHIPAGRILGRTEAIDRYPALANRPPLAAALWHDAAMPDSQRLLVELLRWAVARGAATLNYVEAVSIEVERDTVVGMSLRDVAPGADGREYAVETRTVVNCAGPWCRDVATAFDRDVPSLFPYSIAFNLLIDRPQPSDCALAVDPPGGPTFFLHPWKGRLFAGTVHAPWEGPRSDAGPTDAMIAGFVTDLNAAVPGLDVTPDDVLRVHWGYLPAREAGTARLAVRPAIVRHADHDGPRGLFSVSGVKFTTARHVAERVLDVLARDGRVTPGATDASSPTCTAHPNRSGIERLLERDRDAAETVVRRIAAEESVVTPEDLLLRRTDWAVDPVGAERIERFVAAVLARGDSGSDRAEARVDGGSA